MSGKIITTYLSTKHFGNDVLRLDFNSNLPNSIDLEMELSGVNNCKDAIWELYSDNVQLDVGDLTRGCNAQFIMLKSYAGSYEQPHIFTIKCRTEDGQQLAALMISVYARSEIKDAHWTNSVGDKIYEASINRNFTANFKGIGLYNIPLKLDFYLLATSGEDMKLPEMSRRVQITTEDDLESFYIDKETLYDHKGFFLRNVPRILVDKMTNATLAVTGDIRDSAIAKAYFTITSGEKILFHGKNKEVFLDITFTMQSLVPEEKVNSISPVVVYKEQYFTQKYEPCKYEKIFYKYGNNSEEELFDEDKPTQKNKDGSFKNSRVEISVIAPPRKSKNIKDLQVRLEKVETKQCSLNENNKKLTAEPDDDKKSHEGNVIDCKEVLEANIEVIVDKKDEKVTIKPSFNYQYDKNSAWEFMKNYFLFSTLLDSKDVTQNDLKGFLIGWEAETKGIIDVHKIRLQTCRYQKALYLKTFADVAWAFHAMFDDPLSPVYYNDNTKINTVIGLDEELDWLRDSPLAKAFYAPNFGTTFGIDIVRGFILDIIKDMAQRYELGFTAYYDFDADGKKNNLQIDYATTHPNVFKAMIAGAVTLEILIDVLLIILTEGAALANFISKLGKASKIIKRGNKIIKAGEKADELREKYSSILKGARVGKITKNTLELMKGQYYKGYRFVDDPDIGVQPLLEERVKISPLINVGFASKKDLGEFLLDISPVGMTLNLAKVATTGFQLGISAYFIKKIKVNKRKGVFEAGKETVSTIRAVNYPLRIAGYAVGGVYDLLAFGTKEAVRLVFGAEAEFEKEIIGHIDLDFHLKIHNAQKKLDLISIAKGDSKVDKSSISIGTSAGMTVRLKLSGSVSENAIVKAMHMLTWEGKEPGLQELKGNGEVKGNIFVERRYFFEANKPAPYFEDRVVFTGLAGEYTLKKKREKNPRANKKVIIVEEKQTKQFILMEAYELKFNSSEVIQNPASEK